MTPTLEFILNELIGGVVFGSIIIVIPLVITVALEVTVAALFRIDRRGLIAVGLVSGVTNPPMNFVLVSLYALGIGYRQAVVFDGEPFYRSVPEIRYLCLALELLVILIEWRLLVWALGGRVSSRKLLALSVTMNVVTAVAGFLIFFN